MSRFELALLQDEGEPQLFNINPEGAFIGRSDKMDITVDGNTVSRRHVRLWEEGDALHVEDLSSRNGIVVNGERVRSAKLKSGDHIAVGQNFFWLHDTNEPRPKEWPKPSLLVKQTQTNGNGGESMDDTSHKSKELTWSSEESEWFRYILDPAKLQKKIAAAALGAASANRAYVLTGGSGTQKYRVLAAETSSQNPDGPPINDVLVDRVFRGKKAIAVEGGMGAGATGAACAPMIGNDRCVGVLYVDDGLGSATFDATKLEQLARFGRTAGRLLQTAANLKTMLGQMRSEGMRIVAEAAARELGAAREAGGEALEYLQSNLATLGREDDASVSALDLSQVVARVADRFEENGVVFHRNGRAIAYANDRDIEDAVSNLIRAGVRAKAPVSIRVENKIDGCYVEVSGLEGALSEAARDSLANGRSALKHGVDLAAICTAVERNKGSVRIDANGQTVTLVFPQREA